MKKEGMNAAIPDKFGYYTAIAALVSTLITFGIAIFTPPISGSFCKENCVQYPFLDIVSRFPRDYIWMYFAIILMLIYVVLMVCIHHYAAKNKRIFSQIGLAFALVSACAIIIDYFVQISVIQPSLLMGETEGIALWTQYNPHGIFIALEEIGYLMMSLSFFFAAFVFSKSDNLEKPVFWTFLISFPLNLAVFAAITVIFGIFREYYFEVYSITINWLVLLVGTFFLSRVFRLSNRID